VIMRYSDLNNGHGMNVPYLTGGASAIKYKRIGK
jgi:hypothetical protein